MNKKRMAGDSGSESRPQSAEGACLDAGSESPRHLFGHSGSGISGKRDLDGDVWIVSECFYGIEIS